MRKGHTSDMKQKNTYSVVKHTIHDYSKGLKPYNDYLLVLRKFRLSTLLSATA